MNKHQNYINLLESILENSIKLKDSATVLLERLDQDSVNVNNHHLVGHAQYLIFLSIEELGKIYYLFSYYPKDLPEKKFLNNGAFYDHNKKIKELIKKIREYYLKGGKISNFTIDQIITFLRSFKEKHVYVDYIDSKIILPLINRGPRRFTWFGWVSCKIN